MTAKTWLIIGIGLGLAVVLGANAHLLYVSLASAPGCAEATRTPGADGEARVLQAAKGGC